MILLLEATYNEIAFARRIAQIFGVENYISAPGANLTINHGLTDMQGLYRSIGTGNNIAYKKSNVPGCYYLWIRDEVYPNCNHTWAPVLKDLL